MTSSSETMDEPSSYFVILDRVTSAAPMTYEELMPMLPGDDVIIADTSLVYTGVNSSSMGDTGLGGRGGGGGHQVYPCGVFQFVWNTLVLGLLCLFGFVGNTLSFAVLSRDRSNRVACLLLQALAVADNSVLVISFLVFSLIYGLQGFPGFVLYRYLPFVVKWLQPLGYMTQTAAVWCTVLLAVNRYVALCLPFQANRWATVRLVRLQLLGLVIGLLVLNVPRFFQYEVITKVDPVTNHTHYEYAPTAIGEQSVFGKVYTNAIYTVVVLLLPLLLLLILNTRIIREIRHLNERHAAITYGRTAAGDVARQTANGGGADRDENMTKIVKDIVGSRPLGCGHTLYYVFNSCNMLVVLNSSSNFVIYYVMRRRFRRILLEKICGLRRQLSRSLHSFRMSTTDSGVMAAQLAAAGINAAHPSDHRKDTTTSAVEILDFAHNHHHHNNHYHHQQQLQQQQQYEHGGGVHDNEIEQRGARDEGEGEGERLCSPT